MNAQQIIKRPLLTEKGNRLKDGGGPTKPEEGDEYSQKFLFEVASTANKFEIRDAIQKLFKVSVTSVHTQLVRGKEKRIGKFQGRRPNWKKAIVTLAPGQTIEFFEGV